MIKEFIKTMQSDFKCLNDFMLKSESHSEDHKRVTQAALRILSALGIAYAASLGIEGFFKVTGAVSGVFMMGYAFVIYMVAHDIFLLASRSQYSMKDHLKSLCKNTFFQINGFIGRLKNLKVNSPSASTEGTYFKPLWNLTAKSSPKE